MRCAIYTRKSTEEGLEQEFNTLQAQREAAEAYIASHRGEGWQVVPTRYDDGGWSGASLERPALQRLQCVELLLQPFFGRLAGVDGTPQHRGHSPFSPKN